MNFLYVCQSVSWLTSLLKLSYYGDISSSEWDIFLKFLETFPGYFWTISKIFCIFCMSVSLSLRLLYLFQFFISGGQLLRALVLFFPNWFCRCKVLTCLLSQNLGLWTMLRVPDWVLTPWYWYCHFSLISPMFQI